MCTPPRPAVVVSVWGEPELSRSQSLLLIDTPRRQPLAPSVIAVFSASWREGQTLERRAPGGSVFVKAHTVVQSLWTSHPYGKAKNVRRTRSHGNSEILLTCRRVYALAIGLVAVLECRSIHSRVRQCTPAALEWALRCHIQERESMFC